VLPVVQAYEREHATACISIPEQLPYDFVEDGTASARKLSALATAGLIDLTPSKISLLVPVSAIGDDGKLLSELVDKANDAIRAGASPSAVLTRARNLLTEKGVSAESTFQLQRGSRADISVVGKGFMHSTKEEFCYGVAEVKSISTLTEPAPEDGLMVRFVQYDYEVDKSGIAKWAFLPAINAEFPDIGRTVNFKHSRRLKLVETSSGWVVAKSLWKHNRD
jgi:hypothetical protein